MSETPGVRLGNETLFVDLSPELPILRQLGAAADRSQALPGDPLGRAPIACVHADGDAEPRNSAERGIRVSYACTPGGAAVEYRARVSVDSRVVAGYTLTFAARGGSIDIRLDQVTEQPGWRLMHVDLPALVSADTDAQGTRMVIGTHAGRLVDPALCEPGAVFHKYGWVRDAFSTVGLVHGPGLTAIVALESLDDTILSSVADRATGRCASLGVRLLHRHPADAARYRFSPHSCTSASIHLVAEPTGPVESGWTVGARWLRDRHTAPKPDIYRDRMVYKIHLACPASGETTTFDQALEIIRDIHALTDGAGQVAYLVGFQHDGHDTGYPDVFTENPHAGGRDALLRLMAAGPALNTLVSFHDNYDDAYEASPLWDPDDISTNLHGELLKGGVWNGGQAHWISMPHYVATKAAARIDATLARYPIRESYHLDVLTASVFRVDYRPGDPTGKDADWKARMDLVRMWRERGIDLSSEGCGLPFLDHFAYFWNLPRTPRSVYAGDTRIPFGPFVAHGHVNYGGSHADDHWTILDGLLYGAHYSNDLRASTSRKEMTDAYYLLEAPMNLLRSQQMAGYDCRGPMKRVTYADGSLVEVDYESRECRVAHGGRTLLEDHAVLLEGNRPGTLLAYRGSDEWAPALALPHEWAAARTLRATPLAVTGDGEPVEIACEAGKVTIDFEPGVPHRLERV